jgi:phage baseplate assembly protein W
MNVDYPYRLDARGRTATTGDEDHVRDMIEQVLFTSPGERVNRPTFGAGLMQLVFAPNSPELAAATRAMAQASLAQWLSGVVDIEAVEAASVESTLQVTVRYSLRATGERREAQFERST